MNPSWLTERVTVEAEAQWKPLRNYPLWYKLKASMKDGDELWNFRSPPHTWPAKLGAAGVALVRDGKIIDNVTVLRT
jgi:predicted RNA-binding protein with PUA-like domain